MITSNSLKFVIIFSVHSSWVVLFPV
jgi:hypothetical protein